MGLKLTKEFVNSCRKVGVLRDFLCQAIDQVDEKDKEIAELKERYKDMDVTHTVHIAKMNALIEELEESQRWRKFPDEKPEKREIVFVRMSDGFYRIAMYLARGLGWDIGDGTHHKSEEVTHWMPLPKTLEDR